MNLALLAHHAASPAFNGLFYATAATIIPVLFLAIAVQGLAFQQVLLAMRWLNGATNAARRRHDYYRRYSLPLGLATIAAMLIAAAIPYLGAAGEIDAILALYHQQASGAGSLVLAATILLAIVAAGGPAIAFVGALNRVPPRVSPFPYAQALRPPPVGYPGIGD
jgi:hypothetical protein